MVRISFATGILKGGKGEEVLNRLESVCEDGRGEREGVGEHVHVMCLLPAVVGQSLPVL